MSGTVVSLNDRIALRRDPTLSWLMKNAIMKTDDYLGRRVAKNLVINGLLSMK